MYFHRAWNPSWTSLEQSSDEVDHPFPEVSLLTPILSRGALERLEDHLLASHTPQCIPGVLGYIENQQNPGWRRGRHT